MASDYEAITAYNERQLGLDTASRKTQICMYSDSTHFVYEILQNADDHGASMVSFTLAPDALTIEHNGQPFSPENVKAITYFGKSTSRDDLVKTGRFGVGFKSVFAFTATPTILSGDEHFQIFGLYRLRETLYPADFQRAHTRIILPFNHTEERPDFVEELVSPEQAFAKIAARLKGISMNALLFTRNVREIQWHTPHAHGHYLREDKNVDGIRWTTTTDGENLRRFLVFSRTPTWRSQEYKPIELAFGLDEKGQVSSVEDYLYVLFATTQETHLFFLLNGPYRTNPSRETISEDDPFNLHLMKETAALVENILPRLRDMKLLTPIFLGVLPNDADKLRDFYAPIRAACVSAFRENDLVPTDDDNYAQATAVLQGPAQIREVITREEILFMGGGKASPWAKGVTLNSRPDAFLRSLGIKQWGWEELGKAISEHFTGDKYHMAETLAQKEIAWLRERKDSWMQKFYLLLDEGLTKGQLNQWRLRDAHIVRVHVSGEESHVPGPKAYFPKGRAFGDLPQVKSAILRGSTSQATERLQKALETLGVAEIGDAEQIDLILNTFYGDEHPEVTPKQHFHHMSAFVKCWKKERSIRHVADFAIFRTTGNTNYRKGSECYIDKPLRTTDLHAVYKGEHCGISDRHPLWPGYRAITSDDFYGFAVACGVAEALPIARKFCRNQPCHPHWSTVLFKDLGWSRETSTKIDKDYTIPDLTALLAMQSIEVNAIIWRTVSKADPEVLQASYRPNRQYGTRTDKSTLVYQLGRAQWIPDKSGAFHKSAEIDKEDLHPDFHYDNRNGWLDAIGFGENAQRASAAYKRLADFANELGVEPKLAELIRASPPEDRQAAKEFFETRAAARRRLHTAGAEPVAFHEALAEAFTRPASREGQEFGPAGGPSADPKRRRERTGAEIAAALEAEPSPESRVYFGVCRKWKGKDDAIRVALLTWYAGKCQICGETFTQRNGTPYFEGVYLVPYTRAEWLDRAGNVVCVCARHSAMLQFGPLEEDAPILDQILALKTVAEGGAPEQSCLCLTLCGEQVNLRYAEKHFIDLQEMIKASQKASGGA